MAFKIDGLTTFPIAAAEKMLGRKVTPPPGGELAWIDYPGPPRTLQYISFDDVENGRLNPADVRGRLVVVGASAPSLQDRHATSTSGNEPDAGSGDPGRRGRHRDGGLPAALGTGMAQRAAGGGDVGAHAARRAASFGDSCSSSRSACSALAALLVGVQLAFNAGTIITVIYAVVAGVLAILATSAINGLTVAFERAQARDAFARFVPEAVVDQVLASADGVRLGGVRGEATVMFSDLRGFTSFSETLEPERVIESLNRYLTEMSEAILDHGGTLVAYMGDGIMAVFGAPLKQEDHADRALEAAREMLGRMERFNGWLREQELHDGFKMGIGLNSGPVMSGNVGSERRLEYTALGDTTNTAARLEGMTKGTPHQLYISDTTKQKLTRAPDDLVDVGEAEVRGRKGKVLLWSLRDGDTPPNARHRSSETVEA